MNPVRLNTKNRSLLHQGSLVGFVFLISCSSAKTLDSGRIELGNDSQRFKPNAEKIASGSGLKLSAALESNLRSEAIGPEREAFLRKIAFSMTHRKDKKGMSEEQCREAYPLAEECRVLSPQWAQSWMEEFDLLEGPIEGTSKKVPRAQRQKIIDQLLRSFRAGEPTYIPGQRPGDYYVALKKFTSWTPALQVMAEDLIQSPRCDLPELHSYLGLKAEEYFPNADLLKLALSLYGRVDECNRDQLKQQNKYAQNARFRLGLLQILAQDCQKATEVFERLAQAPTSDYSSRAWYWKAHCARAASDNEKFLDHFGSLFKSNPLGFHTLSIAKGDSVLIENLGKPIDPIVKTRTEKQNQFNVWIDLLESFDKLKEFDAVRRGFAPIKYSADFLMNFEPSVRLYLATFAYRSGDRISLFRILDSVFRTQSEYVVDSTLKMFYPTDFFAEVLAHTQKVNPFLIAALIRQESAFAANARSPVGAVGLMQLMPATARLLDRSVKKKDLLNPTVNIRLGTRYFEQLVDRFHGDVQLALAAYNAGPEVVSNWQRRYPVKNKMLFIDLIPYSETRNYVTLIGRNYYWYTQLYADSVNGLIIDVAQRRDPAVFDALTPEDE